MTIAAFIRQVVTGVFLLVAFAVLGCGEAPPKMSAVAGKVNLDGAPMEQGEIFLSGQGTVITQTLAITKGEFKGEIVPGTYTVQIFSYVEVPPTPDATGYVPPDPIRNNVIPAQWNTGSTLSAVIPDGGKTDLSFDITSK